MGSSCRKNGQQCCDRGMSHVKCPRRTEATAPALVIASDVRISCIATLFRWQSFTSASMYRVRSSASSSESVTPATAAASSVGTASIFGKRPSPSVKRTACRTEAAGRRVMMQGRRSRSGTCSLLLLRPVYQSGRLSYCVPLKYASRVEIRRNRSVSMILSGCLRTVRRSKVHAGLSSQLVSRRRVLIRGE